MERKLVTCPETGHLEQVELDRTPVGVVIHSCSRFDPPCAVACPRECARRMDRRDRRSRDRILVIRMDEDNVAAPVVDALTDELGHDGFVVDTAMLGCGLPPPPSQYAGVVIGAPVQLGAPACLLGDYLRAHAAVLTAMPAFLVAVGHQPELSAGDYVTRLMRSTGWQPAGHAAFAGASDVPRAVIRDLAHRIGDEIPMPAARAV